MANTAIDSFSYDPLPGKTLGGRYVIDRLIGRGGVGLVYLANDTVEDDRQVVVKVLAPHWAEDRDATARFDREALRMAKLDHHNVVRMYDHGHFDDGRAYIVMEFIRGEPLRRYLGRRKRLPLEEFIPIASQILLGVGYVHERGIMLRDIKPPNIMLCERAGKANHVKMLDFGLARLIEEEDEEVTKAHVIGTAAYMSPEQIKGEKIDVRVDVYALGVLFFLMLTGEMPIAGDNDAAVLVNHVHGRPKRLIERLPKSHRIPPRLIEMIESCLAKDPDDRPSDANAMVEELFEFIPAPLLSQPKATAKTRAAADTYWSARMNSGPVAVAAVQSDTNDSAEWTRPLLRKAARTGEAPLKLAEEEIAAQRAQAQSPPPVRRSAGSGARRRPGPPPPPKPKPKAKSKPEVARGNTVIPTDAPAASTSSVRRLAQSPSSSTVRVTAADAREAVERLDAELEARRTGKVETVPITPADSDVLPISIEEDDTVAANGNTESTPVVAGATVPVASQAGGFGAGIVADSDEGSGGRMGMLLAVGGVAALLLGGLSAWVVFGGDGDGPNVDAVATAEAKPAQPAEPADAPELAAAQPPETPSAEDEPTPDFGTVEVRAVAGARVEVDGEDRGEAPVQLELALGEHRVRVSAPGHHPWESTIDVSAGANAAVKAELVVAQPGFTEAEAIAEPAVGGRGGRTGRGGRGRGSKRPGTAGPPQTSADSPPANKPKPKSKPKSKSGVFMESPKPKDDGIFLPVGGK